MSGAPCLAKAAAKNAGKLGSPNRVVPQHLRVVQKDFLTRSGGRNTIRSSVAVDYSRAYQDKYRKITVENQKLFDPNACPRLIDAEVIHKDEQAFWSERRSFYNSAKPFFPVWDRQAQALVLLTRHVARAPTEAAFRLFTLGLKLMFLPQLLNYSQMLLPTWTHGGMNVEALLKEVKEGKDDTKADNNSATEKKADEAAAESPSEEKKE